MRSRVGQSTPVSRGECADTVRQLMDAHQDVCVALEMPAVTQAQVCRAGQAWAARAPVSKRSVGSLRAPACLERTTREKRDIVVYSDVQTSTETIPMQPSWSVARSTRFCLPTSDAVPRRTTVCRRAYWTGPVCALTRTPRRSSAASGWPGWGRGDWQHRRPHRCDGGCGLYTSAALALSIRSGGPVCPPHAMS
jgi:hypothetical protein